MQDGSADIRVNFLTCKKITWHGILNRSDKSYANKVENLETHFSFALKFWSENYWLIFSTE